MASIYKDRSTGRWVAETAKTHNGEPRSERFTSKHRHIVEKKLQDYLNPTATDPNLTILGLLQELDMPEFMLKHLDPYCSSIPTK